MYLDTWKIFKNIWQKNEEKYFCSQKPNFWDLVKVKVTNFPNYPEMTYVINVPTYLVIMTLYLDGPLKKDIWRMAIKKSLKCSKSNNIIWTVLNCMNTILTKSWAIPAYSFKRQKCIYKEKKKTLFVSKQYFKSKSIELFFQIKNRLLENLFWKSSILAPIYWTKKLTQHFRNDGPISNWKSSCNHNSYMHRNWKGICKLKQLSQQKNLNITYWRIFTYLEG